jgi:hypothetical protein
MRRPWGFSTDSLDRLEVEGMLRSRPRTLVTIVCLLCVVVLAHGCDSTCKPEREAIHIDNGSFEIEGSPSFAGWTLLNPDLADTLNDGAPGSGSWSLRLQADTDPTSAVAWQEVEGAADGDVLTLTAYVKAYRPGGFYYGGGLIGLVSGSHPLDVRLHPLEVELHPWAASDSRDWVRLTTTDTLSLSPRESVWVVLSSYPLPDSLGAIFYNSVGFFDDVRVVREGE